VKKRAAAIAAMLSVVGFIFGLLGMCRDLR